MKEKKLTKGKLFWRCGKGIASAWLLILSFVLVAGVIEGILHHTRVLIILFISVLEVFLLCMILLVVFLSGQGKGLFLLRRQEKLFGFRFADEGLDSEHPDDRWFLSTDFYLLAFRRGYIRKTGKIRRLYEHRSLGVIEILDCEGKKHRIRGFEPELLALKQWVASGQAK